MSNHHSFKEKYNDRDTEIDADIYETLRKNDVDEKLAKHVAHLFIRDPLVIFSDRIEVDDVKTTEHFENIQSTNWQTMRWKPPPPNSQMGWRVEFRPMEVQFTDFENAAFTIVIILLARVVLFFDLNMYMPISRVDENMKTSHHVDAVLKEKFYFRKNLIPLSSLCGDIDDSESNLNNFENKDKNSRTKKLEEEDEDEDENVLMSIDEILHGRGEEFPGLFPLIRAYLDIIKVDPETATILNIYLDLISARARGELPTPARWIRNFVEAHPEYKQDSVVSASIEADLIDKIVAIGNGQASAKETSSLLGKQKISDINDEESNGDRYALDLERPSSPLRLRGSSFQSDFPAHSTPELNDKKIEKTQQCKSVQELVARYKRDGAIKSHVVNRTQKVSEVVPLLGRLMRTNNVHKKSKLMAQ